MLNVHYYHKQGQAQTLVASASFAPINKPLREQQRQTVRQLLQLCQQHYYPDTQFADTCYPYTLCNANNERHFVSFSHSDNQVAVAIAPTACGVDIELGVISLKIAKRFFHCNELVLIELLNGEQQLFALKILWQLKECLAKVHNTGLYKTLSQDLSDWLSIIIDKPEDSYYIGDYRLLILNPIITVIKV